MKKIQFNVTDAEFDYMIQKSLDEGFPNVAEMCKSYILKRSTITDLYREMLKAIDRYPSGKTFILRDLIDTPPALLGRWLFEGVESGRISGVKYLGKHGSDGAAYIKEDN